MRILVVGAGATGGYFGGRLALAGRNVTFLVRPVRAAQLRATGLQIVSPHGDVSLAPMLVTAGELAGGFDVVLLTVKAYALAAALDDLAPAVAPQTMILPVLNGMRHVELIAGRFGGQALVGGVCKIATTVDERGRIVQLSPLHSLAYGEMSGEVTARVTELDRAMSGAGFDARLSGVIEQDMWDKWVLLASLGGITCLMRGTVGEVASAAGGAAFAAGFVAECVAVAAASGHPPSRATVDGIGVMMQAKQSGQTSSMYRDLHRGSPIEADQILGDLLARAERLGVKTPLLRVVVTQLSVYQNRLGGDARA